MKKSFIVPIVIAIVFAASCNMKKDSSKTDAGTATDSSMMSRTDSSAQTVTTSGGSMQGDTSTGKTTVANTVNDSASKKVAMAKPDSLKKGKKGKVSIKMGENKTGGDMSADKEGYYASTEILPAFPGGQKALEQFFEKNIQYPADATDNGVEGTVDLNFAVDEMGKVYAPKLTSKKIGYGIEDETLRVFSKMPKWTPGKIKGKNVKTRYTLPVTFQLY